MINETYRQVLKKNFVSNGASSLLQLSKNPNSTVSLGFAFASMVIDSYNPSISTTFRSIDKHDAKIYLTKIDMLNGCERSLVKYFANQIPCKCLDEIHSQMKSAIPKIGSCISCKQRKERTSMFICTGCERIQYCSKACQIAHVPKHKDFCKMWQRYDSSLMTLCDGRI